MPPRIKKNQAAKAATLDTTVPLVSVPLAPVPLVSVPLAPVPLTSSTSTETAKGKRGRKTATAIPVISSATIMDETPPIVQTQTKHKNKKTKTKKETNEINEPMTIDPNNSANIDTATAMPTITSDAEGIVIANAAVVATNKKRGRKPKGGKVIQLLANDNATINVVPNIILHLKCNALDIQNNELSSNDKFKPGDVVSFNAMENKGSDLNDSYQSHINSIMNDDNKSKANDALMGNNAYNYLNDNESDDNDDDDNNSIKDILKKLNHLKTSFHRSDVFQAIGAAPRRSCCFWDTCEFDTPPIYLPKSISNNGGYVVYACFCSPECALAYLMNERIDTSVKFERCQMLNAMHGKICVSIKPAPNPQYILSKFYGNLTIQEYRKLFKSEQIVYVVNKPLTHILPEIYEENNDFMLNNKIIPTNNYKLKKKTSVFG